MNDIQVFDLHPLFEDVQLKGVFEDSKTFVDCIPRGSLEEINRLYATQRVLPGFDIAAFVHAHFDQPVVFSTPYTTDIHSGIEAHLEKLWTVLRREPGSAGGSLIPLPYPYIVPGGRFGEIYYWDSYFTMIGLLVAGRAALVENMIDNFSYLINTIGFIPNGNRSYFLSRSQPPFFAMMVELLAKEKGPEILLRYLPQMEKEYTFWMQGKDELNEQNRWEGRTVLMPGKEILNRYCDNLSVARPEAYRQEVEMVEASGKEEAVLYRHLRSGAESGWDFSSRWYAITDSFDSTHTTEIMPVDLNCLLYKTESIIAEAYRALRQEEVAARYEALAAARKQAILRYCWNETTQFYSDYDSVKNEAKPIRTAAAFFPLFTMIADAAHVKKMLPVIEQEFLCAGGIVTTLNNTGQQWDAPNGWAPLQWVAITGLLYYGYDTLAATIAQRWMQLNITVFEQTGKLMEKYNVQQPGLEAGGGEYPGQDGFGWTNGVLLGLIKKFGLPPA